MIVYALNFAFGCFGLALLLNMVQIFRSKGVVDKVLALDTMVINSIAIIILWGISSGLPLFFQAAMILAMTGFISTVAYCKFLLRGDIIE